MRGNKAVGEYTAVGGPFFLLRSLLREMLAPRVTYLHNYPTFDLVGAFLDIRNREYNERLDREGMDTEYRFL